MIASADSTRRNRPGFTIRAAAAVLTMLAFAADVIAQDEIPSDSTAEVDPASIIPALIPAIPPQLPGHETGERQKPAASQPVIAEEEAPEWFGGKPWLEWSHFTGNWGGARTKLEDAGVDFQGSWTLEWSGVFSGGEHRSGSHRRLLDLNLTLDLEKLVSLEGGKFYIDFYSYTGPNGSSDAGDFQGFSNIASDGHLDQIAELWYEQWLFDKAVRVKAGKVDANTEFAFVNVAGDPLCSSAAISPTIIALPTYPDPATGVNLFIYPTSCCYLGLGAYDGAGPADGVPTGSRGPATFFSDSKSDDWFLIGEGGFTWDCCCGCPHGGRCAAGVWHHTGRFDEFDGSTKDGTTGFYLMAEQTLWKPADCADDEDPRGVAAYLRYGWADADVSEAHQHLGGGVALTGTFAGRDADAAGVYLSWVDLSDEPGAGFERDESSIEAYYKIQLTPAVFIQPDLQYFIDPSGRDDIDDALVGSVRVQVTF